MKKKVVWVFRFTKIYTMFSETEGVQQDIPKLIAEDSSMSPEVSYFNSIILYYFKVFLDLNLFFYALKWPIHVDLYPSYAFPTAISFEFYFTSTFTTQKYSVIILTYFWIYLLCLNLSSFYSTVIPHVYMYSTIL